MYKKLTPQEIIREERHRALAESAKRNEMEELMLEQMVEIDFRQSLTEMEVKI